MHVSLSVSSEVDESSARIKMLEAMFDVPVQEKSGSSWEGDIDLDFDWQIGLIVGPSGAGKSTIARHIFGEQEPMTWNAEKSVIDNFPSQLPMPEITEALSSVGFNTIPAWMRPFHVLSTGEQFRASIARALLSGDPMRTTVVDEFTSVVDRQVAKIASHAIQKFVRRGTRRFVAVSCHYDVIDWLQPDWILHMPTLRLERRSVQPRPGLDIIISRVPYSAWAEFAPFHYLTSELNKAAKCFCLFVEDEHGRAHPAAFGATLHRPHAKVNDIEGLSRLVTLPDWQGLGLAFVLSDALGAAFAALGKRLHTYPAHPALIRGYDRSRKYSLEKRPGHYSPRKGDSSSVAGKFGGRPCAVFCYRGESMDPAAAQRLVYPEDGAR